MLAAIAASAGALWLRSYWVRDDLLWTSAKTISSYGVRSSRGSMLLFYNADLLQRARGLLNPPGFRHLALEPVSNDSSPVPTHAAVLGPMGGSRTAGPGRATRNALTSDLHLAGIRLESGQFDRVRCRQLILPYWLPNSLADLALLGAVLKYVQSRARECRTLHGRCPACGYDLRASPDRCPECGAPAATAPPTSPRPT
jgi:hypothetical protein